MMAIPLSACGSSDKPNAEGELIVVGSGGTYGRGLTAAEFGPFEKETGVKVRFVDAGDDPVAQIRAQVQSKNVQWDLFGCTSTQTSSFPELFEDIDYNVVKSADDLIVPEAKKKKSILHDLEAYPLLAYRSDKHEPASWADFFDVKTFNGPRGVPNSGLETAWSMPAVALLADGVRPEDLVPFDLERAFRKLDELKPSIKAYATSYSQMQDLLRSGEVEMAVLTDGRALQLKVAGTPVDVVWDGAFALHAEYCILKDAPNSANANRFIEWYLANPDAQATFSAITNYGPPTKSGVNSAKQLDIEDFTSLHAEELIPQSDALLKYVEENADELIDRWNTFVQQDN